MTRTHQVVHYAAIDALGWRRLTLIFIKLDTGVLRLSGSDILNMKGRTLVKADVSITDINDQKSTFHD
jgi:hypothetical protein